MTPARFAGDIGPFTHQGRAQAESTPFSPSGTGIRDLTPFAAPVPFSAAQLGGMTGRRVHRSLCSTPVSKRI